MANPCPVLDALFAEVMLAPLAMLTTWSILMVPAAALEEARTDTAPALIPVTLAFTAVYVPRFSMPLEPRVVKNEFLKLWI